MNMNMNIKSSRARYFLTLSLSGLFVCLTLKGKGEEKVSAAAVATADDAVEAEDELAKKLANPLAAMISVPFQNNFDFGGGPNGEGVQWKMNIQPVIPMSINEDWNLIARIILPVVSQTDVIGTSSQSGLSDAVVSAWLSPTAPTSSGWILGAGVASLLPTGTDDLLTANQWGVGPTFIALKQTSKFTYGALMNQLWAADTLSDRATVNQMFLQPFFSYIPGGGWTYTINSEAAYDFTGGQWTVPINLMVTKMIKLGKQPAQWQLGARYYPEAPQNGPEWGIRFGLVLLFPK